MNIFRKTVRTLSVCALAVIITAAGIVPCFADSGDLKPKKEIGSLESFEYVPNNSYSAYMKSDEALPDADKGIDLDVFNTADGSDGKKESFLGREGLLIEEGGKVVWKFTVPKAGAYNIKMDYYIVPGVTTAAKFAVGIDGYYPFSEAESVSLSRVWIDGDKTLVDTQGNQVRPSSSESAEWQSEALADTNGFSQEIYRFYLTEGEHEISFEVFKNSFAVGSLSFTAPETAKSYAELLAEYKKLGYKDATKALEPLQAENIRAKSDKSITTMNDRGSPMTYPSDSFNVVYNCIGGSNWNTAGQWVEWDLEVPEDGLYTIVLRFKQSAKANDVSSRALYIDGELPFAEAERLIFDYSSGWQVAALGDGNGAAYKFYLTKGTHTLRLVANLGNYSDVLSDVNTALSDLNEIYRNILMVTGSSPDTDRDYEFDKLIPETLEKINVMIGTLKELEQRVETITSGGGQSTAVFKRLYTQLEAMAEKHKSIAKRFSTFKTNITSLGTWINDARSQPLAIDYIQLSTEQTELPEKEAGFFTIIWYYIKQFFGSFVMDYSTVGNLENDADKEITVWIATGRDQADIIRQMGTHTLRLVANLGNYSDVLSDVNTALSDLNEIYRNILMVTGSSPDTDRDYEFDKLIPETLEKINVMIGTLKELEQRVETITSGGGQSTAVFKRLYTQLEAMAEKHKSIAKRFSTFKTNITSLGTWINDARSQPLAIDYIQLSTEQTELPEKEAGFFTIIWYYIKQFFGSFVMDYSTVGNLENDADKEITVWIATGRDQADIIRQMANDTFTPQHGISANIQLVNAGALLPATLAGIGPDVYIGMDETSPVNYALRNAVVDLSKLEGVDEVTSRFYESALLPFRLDGGLYAIPETMVYPMMFYRKDILTDLGITEEDLTTWDSLLQKVLPELEMNYFEFGMTTTIKNYAMLLEQYGGKFYNDDNTASALSSQEALKAFQHMTALFTDYGLDLTFDFSNRFRSGEMPLAITDFSAYNQMSVFAPEIDGLWGMMPVPGTKDENGNINNATVCTVTGVVILSKSKDVDSAWEFVKWWTEAEVQSRYGTDLETVMGTGARYASANVEAMKSVQWDRNVSAALMNQLESVVGMPQIAGSYFTSRHFDFAFRDVVYSGLNAREALEDASEDITNEIQDKRNEFYGE